MSNREDTGKKEEGQGGTSSLRSEGASRQGSGDYLYLPWKQDPEYPCDLMDCAGQGIGSMDKEHDAAFVVRAVNCHDELVAALRGLSDGGWTREGVERAKAALKAEAITAAEGRTA